VIYNAIYNMKIRVVNTPTGFVPETDADYELKKKLKRGAVYEAVFREVRNPKFHRLFFALLNTSWEYLTEEQQAFFKNNVDKFRETLLIATGYTETFYDIRRQAWLEKPRSIAFDKMSEADFSDFYERAKDVIFNYFIPDVKRDEFEQQLRFF
jgi:hypothetical protein